ncbi:RNA polymerase sigma factor (sigma-70 family) [Amycolatopsis endophytica]|uniref:RNA polymerase sigma factor (Sigma-70 family) n=1 Tax=Amycolatopsis endophytica TaxID=860233 RepID=A0A853B0B3_9PSEU|nr:RNA polymerase sigma factor (sigma-70 family) [Amycolatopsis endophytica]
MLSIIRATTSGERRSRTLGYYGATGGIAMVVSQFLGGVLVSADLAGSGWRPIFLVNVPIGLLGLVLARRLLPEGRALGWPVWCWVLLAAFPVAAPSFVVVERRLEARGVTPLLPPSVVRIPSMRRGLGVAVPFFLGFGGFLLVSALTLQDGLHLGPLDSGLALTPMALAFLVMSLVSSSLVTRIGRNTIVVGAGQGLTGPTLFRVILSRVPAGSAGAGSGMLTTTQQESRSPRGGCRTRAAEKFRGGRRRTALPDDDGDVSEPRVRPDPAFALLELYESALPEVYGYLLARCGDRSVAEELTSETFLGAVSACRRPGATPVSTPWLIGVARHKLVDHWRRREREERGLRVVHEAEPDTVDPWDAELDALVTREVLAELGAHHRAALTLRYLDGLRVPEVAGVLGRTVHATEALLVRARSAFRAVYREKEVRDD